LSEDIKMVESKDIDTATDTGIIVRICKPEDRRAVREISVQSSIFGEYIEQKLLSEEIVADLLTYYFIEYEPQYCFVAEKNNEVVGYLLGSSDVLEMREVVRSKVISHLIKKIFQDGLIFNSINFKLMKNVLKSYFKGEFKVPDFAQEYRATLHVNISPLHRGKMIGSLLVYHFLQILKERQVEGIHFGVLSEKGKGFFERIGFKTLFSGEYTFLRYLNGETLPHYIMGKKL
jgi:ribosomal protein S18 acetylase RimI-like enzyme